jgi:PPOX class probable F420-dependent enzyme
MRGILQHVKQLTDGQRALLREPNYGVATTLRADGSPHSTVVWVDVDEDGVPTFNTARGRVKPSNLERNGRVALLVVRENDFYDWVSIDGRVELTTDGAEEQIDALSRKYDGEPWTYRPGEERIKVRILPEHISTYR